jgi:hypothetical protein
MDRKKLADEIRAAGFGFRYADGPTFIISSIRGKPKSLHSPRNKARTSDSHIIRMASSCSECGAVASESDQEIAEQLADCYQSFARLIWPCIDHSRCCLAEPYIPVSRKASRAFAKVKARFDAERKALGTSEPTTAEKKIQEKLSRSAEALSAMHEALRSQSSKGIRRKAKKPKSKSPRRKKKR